MSELIHEFTEAVPDREDRLHTARAWGETDGSGRWTGWLEFLPRDGRAALQTARETTQSTREHLVYWAGGLSPAYLEMALRRAEPRTSDEPGSPLPEAGEGAELGPRTHILEVGTLNTEAPAALMGTAPLTPGTRKRVAGAGMIVYDGEDAAAGKPGVFRFRVRPSAEGSGVVTMANRIWTALRDQAAEIRIDGRPVAVESHALVQALREP